MPEEVIGKVFEMSEAYSRFLLNGEEMVETYEKAIKVNGEEEYKGVLTDMRLLLVREDKFHDMRVQDISGTEYVSRRKFGKWLLILGILLSISIVAFPVGILFILMWLGWKKDILKVHGAGRSLELEAEKNLLERIQMDTRTRPKIPIPVELERGEQEVRRAEGVKFETAHTVNRGLLLLTNRRLIFNGSMTDERGRRLQTWALEWSGDDIISVPLPWYSWTTLPLEFHHVTMKKRSDEGEIITAKVEAQTILKDYLGISTLATFNTTTYEFKNVNQPEKWKSAIMELKKGLS